MYTQHSQVIIIIIASLQKCLKFTKCCTCYYNNNFNTFAINSPSLLQHVVNYGIHESIEVLLQALSLEGFPSLQPGVHHRPPAQHTRVKVDNTLAGREAGRERGREGGREGGRVKNKNAGWCVCVCLCIMQAGAEAYGHHCLHMSHNTTSLTELVSIVGEASSSVPDSKTNFRLPSSRHNSSPLARVIVYRENKWWVGELMLLESSQSAQYLGGSNQLREEAGPVGVQGAIEAHPGDRLRCLLVMSMEWPRGEHKYCRSSWI